MSTIKTNAIQTVAGKPILNSTGSILQVVYTSSTGTASGSDSTWVASPLSGSITPSSSSSKILLYFDLPNNYCAGAPDIYLRMKRSGTVIGDYYSSQGYSNTLNAGSRRHYMHIQYLDSPATTSAITYTIEAFSSGGGTYYFPFPSDRGTHSLIMMEVSA
jgi:hypothetical protein